MIARTVTVFIEVPYGKKRVRQAEVNSRVKVARLIPELVVALSLPVVWNGLPLTYHLGFAEHRLDRESSLEANGVKDGCTLLIEVERPETKSLLARLRGGRMSNVTWCCFLTGSPCDKDDIEWDPTKVPVFLPTDYVKSDIVYEYGVRPAINDLGLSASRIRIQLKATSSHQAEPLFPDDQEHRGQELCRICRAAQEGLLTIADVTGGDPMVFLALGLIWGLGQPVILTHLDGAFAPIHTTRFESIPYTDPGDGEFGRQIKLAVQDKTKVTELSQENCIACGGGFGSSEAVIVCLNCRMRYHKQCWPQRCRECGGASYICL